MKTVEKNRLERFHHFVAEQIRSEATARLSPEQALAMWREREETLAAVREGLADLEAGRTWPAEDVIRELREDFPGV